MQQAAPHLRASSHDVELEHRAERAVASIREDVMCLITSSSIHVRAELQALREIRAANTVNHNHQHLEIAGLTCPNMNN